MTISVNDKQPVILVALPNRPFFGACLVLVPALLHLRRSLPNSRIVALACHGMGGLFSKWGLIDEVWRDDAESGFRFATYRRTFAMKPALIVNFRPSSTRVHVWMRLIRAQERRCFAQGLGRFIDRRGRPWDVTRYKAFTYIGVVGAGWDDRTGDLLTDWDLIPRRVDPSGALVLIPSGSHPDKKWPLDRYLELALRWKNQGGRRVQVLVGPQDPEVAQWLASPAVKAAGITGVDGGLPTEGAAIRAASVVVGNDCGPNHLAQLMDRPRVVLFKPTMATGEWFRPGNHARCIRPDVPLAELPTQVVWESLQAVAQNVRASYA